MPDWIKLSSNYLIKGAKIGIVDVELIQIELRVELDKR
jgi:hypothetical protein